jgi:hypothetical protein
LAWLNLNSSFLEGFGSEALHPFIILLTSQMERQKLAGLVGAATTGSSGTILFTVVII